MAQFPRDRGEKPRQFIKKQLPCGALTQDVASLNRIVGSETVIAPSQVLGHRQHPLRPVCIRRAPDIENRSNAVVPSWRLLPTQRTLHRRPAFRRLSPMGLYRGPLRRIIGPRSLQSKCPALSWMGTHSRRPHGCSTIAARPREGFDAIWEPRRTS